MLQSLGGKKNRELREPGPNIQKCMVLFFSLPKIGGGHRCPENLSENPVSIIFI